jgi:transposase
MLSYERVNVRYGVMVRRLDQVCLPPRTDIASGARQQGTWANIRPKRNRKDPICFSPYLYRARNLVERFFNKIKQCRRVATRYDKLAANYLAFVKLASIRIWLRANEPTS